MGAQDNDRTVFNRFHEQLQTAIVNKLGWQSLRPVQKLAGQAILDGKNLIIQAPTAGGKTEAAFFPIFSKMLEMQEEGVQCLYISPLKALLNNQEARLEHYTEMLGLSLFKWHGDAKASAKKKFANDPDDLLMITPESLEVMLVSPKVPVASLFQNLRFVIIDEIHALANCDRGGHLVSVLERIYKITGIDFQRIGLSATVGNPPEILQWMQGSSQREKVHIHPPHSPSKKRLEIQFLDESEITDLVVSRALNKRSLFFCESRRMTEKIGSAISFWITSLTPEVPSVSNPSSSGTSSIRSTFGIC
ncbi:DEAD/DEAH box helicase [Deltaproteobacteria bacterium TL4]